METSNMSSYEENLNNFFLEENTPQWCSSLVSGVFPHFLRPIKYAAEYSLKLLNFSYSSHNLEHKSTLD